MALDGVFMAMKKIFFQKIKFNEEVLGFHGYDLDISLRAAKIAQNRVTKTVVLEHFSFGNPDKVWFENICKIRESIKFKYHSYRDKTVEIQTFNNYLHLLFRYHPISTNTILKAVCMLPYEKWEGIKLILHFIKHKNYYNKKNGHA